MKCKYCQDTKKVPKYFFANSRETIPCSECLDKDIWVILKTGYWSFETKNKSLCSSEDKILLEGTYEEINKILLLLNTSPQHYLSIATDLFLYHYKHLRDKFSYDVWYTKEGFIRFVYKNSETVYKQEEIANPNVTDTLFKIISVAKKMGFIK